MEKSIVDKKKITDDKNLPSTKGGRGCPKQNFFLFKKKENPESDLSEGVMNTT